MEEYRIDKRYFEVLIKAKSRTIVGRVLTRIEKMSNQKELKEVIKDLIPEELRDLITTIEAYQNGILFSLTKKDSTQK